MHHSTQTRAAPGMLQMLKSTARVAFVAMALAVSGERSRGADEPPAKPLEAELTDERRYGASHLFEVEGGIVLFVAENHVVPSDQARSSQSGGPRDFDFTLLTHICKCSSAGDVERSFTRLDLSLWQETIFRWRGDFYCVQAGSPEFLMHVKTGMLPTYMPLTNEENATRSHPALIRELALIAAESKEDTDAFKVLSDRHGGLSIGVSDGHEKRGVPEAAPESHKRIVASLPGELRDFAGYSAKHELSVEAVSKPLSLHSGTGLRIACLSG